MSHRFDWECRCPECRSHVANLRSDMRADFIAYRRERDSKSSPLNSECKSSPISATVASCEPLDTSR